MRAVCIGEGLVELAETGDGLYARSFSGDAYATALYLKRSAPEVQVQLATATGEGSLSEAMRAAWSEAGIELDLAYAVAEYEPGLTMVEADPEGERRVHFWRSNSAARQWFKKLMQNGGTSALEGAHIVMLSGVSLAILNPTDRLHATSMLSAAKDRVGKIAFDLNVRRKLWSDMPSMREALERGMGEADIVRASSEDVSLSYGFKEPDVQLALLRRYGAREAVLTMGIEGCMVASGRDVTTLTNPSAEAARDKAGAGDAFTGAYLAARLGGADPVGAAGAALEVASRVASAAGEIVPAEISHPAAA